MFKLYCAGSKHVKSGFIMGVLQSTWRAMREEARTYQGEVQQQGCALVVGPGAYFYYTSETCKRLSS